MHKDWMIVMFVILYPTAKQLFTYTLRVVMDIKLYTKWLILINHNRTLCDVTDVKQETSNRSHCMFS